MASRVAAENEAMQPQKTSAMQEYKGLLVVSVFLLIVGTLLLAASQATAFDATLRHSVFLVGLTFTFFGFCVFALLSAFALLCKRIRGDRIERSG